MTKENASNGSSSWLFWVAGTTVAIVLASYFLNFASEGIQKDQGVWGQFGDYVGGLLNPAIALLALVALTKTLKLQQDELRLSVRQLGKSAQALEKQAFESTFFQLFGLYTETVAGVEARDSRIGLVYGRSAFRVLHKDLMFENSRANRGDWNLPRRGSLEESYAVFYGNYGDRIGHYFRTIYQILLFVDRSSLDFEEKKVYTRVLRAQLSKYELGLLAYNCISKYGVEKMLPLVQRFDLLQHLESEVLSLSDDALLIE